MQANAVSVDLHGLIDMHVHTAPDVRERALDDIDAASEAAHAGMSAIVIKSHVTATADRAAIAHRLVPSVRVFGGIALNEAVGGLNPSAVEAALQMDARVVWMPTISARNHVVKHAGEPGGISVLTETGQLRPAVFDLFDLVAEHDGVLATGHLSAAEGAELVRAGLKAGLRKVVVSHPEVPWVDMSVETQRALRDLGAYFERCYVSSLPAGGGVPFSQIVSGIRDVGVESTILATDFGAATLPSPVAGMRAFVGALLKHGFSPRDIGLMAGENPAWLLGLDGREHEKRG